MLKKDTTIQDLSTAILDRIDCLSREITYLEEDIDVYERLRDMITTCIKNQMCATKESDLKDQLATLKTCRDQNSAEADKVLTIQRKLLMIDLVMMSLKLNSKLQCATLVYGKAWLPGEEFLVDRTRKFTPDISVISQDEEILN
uniref:Uncharacterized protein n=1 Tax=Romanomermis culicivorax TaxID=13658 RepID=A0A915L0J1_ROMCU